MVLAVFIALPATVLSPMAGAAAAKIALSKDHTDEFYVTTDTGAPSLSVDDGFTRGCMTLTMSNFRSSPICTESTKPTGVSESYPEGY